jgi:thiamine kinase-like enzyme
MRCDTKSVHEIFGKWMGSVEATTPQAVDVIRNLDGIPLSTEEIENFVLPDGEGERSKLKGYSVPESGAWRGLMSNGGRLLLEWEDDEEKDLPSSVFYKRIVMADLAHSRDKLKNSPHKVLRDVRSYQVETSFLTSRACQEALIKETGLKINKVYGSDLRPVATTSSPKEQRWLFDEEAEMAALAEFAKMHAYFWAGSDFWKKEKGELGNELAKAVWENGGYMQPALQGYEQFENVAKGYAGRLLTFEAELKQIPELDGVDLTKIGERLERIVSKVGQLSHPFKGDAQEHLKMYRTLIHGDPKQANIFFRRNKEGNGLDVGFIDFQWCGFGLAATDIAHHISAALLPSCLSYDGAKENDLLDHYHSCLKKELVRFGVATSEQDVEDRVYPRSVLQAQYEIALLDICRMVFAYAWRRWKAETEPTTASLNRNAYNKSFESALWLITRCHALLETRGEEY